MIPVKFKEANTEYGAHGCMTCPAYHASINGGLWDGSTIVVVAWEPSQAEIEEIIKGRTIYISMIGGLAPHSVHSSFEGILKE